MAFTTDTVCLQDLADALQKGGTADLTDFQISMSSKSHAWAYGEIVSALTARGFLIAQITQWDRGNEFERDLSLYRSLCHGGVGQNIDEKWAKTFDRREDLKTVVLTISGVLVQPTGPTGLPRVGVEDTGNDIFVWPDRADDCGVLGKATKW